VARGSVGTVRTVFATYALVILAGIIIYVIVGIRHL
jgi:hypothetical protein